MAVEVRERGGEHPCARGEQGEDDEGALHRPIGLVRFLCPLARGLPEEGHEDDAPHVERGQERRGEQRGPREPPELALDRFEHEVLAEEAGEAGNARKRERSDDERPAGDGHPPP